MNRIVGRFRRTGDPNEARIRRRMAFTKFLSRRLPVLKLALFAIGYLWIILTPSLQLAQNTYIDENALQPGQVNTYWNWGDVHRADNYLALLEQLRDSNATSEQRATSVMTEFNKLGIAAGRQSYNYTANTGLIRGSNAYAVFSSPRASGTEAIVISASWLSRTGDGNGTLNLRGVATVLALAAFLKQYSLWAKDIVFIVSDGYLEGMHAWLSAYHGTTQSNLEAESLTLSSGVIWTALNIDYPGHSFSHLGIFFEGLNGRLPNQDLLNSFQHISRWTGGVPVLLYDHLDPHEHPEHDALPSWLPNLAKSHDAKDYAHRAKNILRHVGYQARGQASGVHGLLHQFRIDAFTLFAVSAPGPHGFHAIGRIVESTLRTANNLLERLHASFFFYILTGPDTFLKIGSYLPSVVLVSVAMMFGGLGEWVDAAWVLDDGGGGDGDGKDGSKKGKGGWRSRDRPVLRALGHLICTHVVGVLLFIIITRPWFIENQRLLSPVVFIILSSLPLVTLFIPAPSTRNLSPLVKSLNLCFSSTVISITSVLNFSLAAVLAVLLGIPLSISSPSQILATRLTKYAAYTMLGLGWLVFTPKEMEKALWNWEVLGVWFAPFVCIVYAPLVLQAGIVCLLT